MCQISEIRIDFQTNFGLGGAFCLFPLLIDEGIDNPITDYRFDKTSAKKHISCQDSVIHIYYQTNFRSRLNFRHLPLLIGERYFSLLSSEMITSGPYQ